MADGRFPNKDADFNDYVAIAIPHLLTNAAHFNLSPETLVILTDLKQAWDLKYPLSQNPDLVTKSITDEKTALRATIEARLRAIYDDLPKSVLTTADRNTLNIPARDTTPTARPAISTTPVTSIKAKEGRKIEVTCHPEGDSNRPSRHKDSDAIEYRYTLALAAPAKDPNSSSADSNSCPVTSAPVPGISTKARFIIELAEGDAGKVITVQCRWKNITDNAKSSSWSNPAQTMVTW